ncbi:hypothetical protein M9H77_13294 [Catharanthus roseus]|uniref:Uncharacterized protein n=1 Tax=Catharanthus roseus TaxID=4058 RepID=A0ACC0BJX1_CATRO|nr:hypothetical protein M9H77_13294 [Catharanthus roseus]
MEARLDSRIQTTTTDWIPFSQGISTRQGRYKVSKSLIQSQRIGRKPESHIIAELARLDRKDSVEGDIIGRLSQDWYPIKCNCNDLLWVILVAISATVLYIWSPITQYVLSYVLPFFILPSSQYSAPSGLAGVVGHRFALT